MRPTATRSRRRTRRRRRDTEAPWWTTLKALSVLAVLGALIYVGVSSYNGVPLEHYQSLTVEVPDIGNLIEHDPVRIAGVRVGQVSSESVTPDGKARVGLQIDPGTRIPVGTQVMVRTNGLLGARYIQLIPSTSRKLLPSGSTVTGGAGALTDGVPEALQTFDAGTRTALGEMINGLGLGLLGQGEGLNAAIHDAAPAATQFTALAQSILARPGAAARLIPALDSTMAPLDASRDQLTELLAPASRALTPLVTQRGQLRQALVDAPPALSSAESGLRTSETLLASADALAVAAKRTLPVLPHGLNEATTLLRTSPTPLRRAKALLGEATSAVPATLKITAALSPVLPPLRQALDNLAPMLVYTGQRGCDIENFGVTLRSMTGYGGVGSGPIGPPMEFRAQIATGPEALSELSSVSPIHHDAYAAPCKYVDRPASESATAGSQP
jgi:phospholipid/cholesterol/gamma-HCH transport system substrate-binding protein